MWQILLPLIIQFIMECQAAGVSERKIMRRLTKPRTLTRMYLAKGIILAEGLEGRALIDRTKQGMDELRTISKSKLRMAYNVASGNLAAAG